MHRNKAKAPAAAAENPHPETVTPDKSTKAVDC